MIVLEWNIRHNWKIPKGLALRIFTNSRRWIPPLNFWHYKSRLFSYCVMNQRSNSYVFSLCQVRTATHQVINSLIHCATQTTLCWTWHLVNFCFDRIVDGACSCAANMVPSISFGKLLKHNQSYWCLTFIWEKHPAKTDHGGVRLTANSKDLNVCHQFYIGVLGVMYIMRWISPFTFYSKCSRDKTSTTFFLGT